MVWDSLHGKFNTPLNDIDIIFYLISDKEGHIERKALNDLEAINPFVNWEVKNQAYMHLHNGDEPYESSIHAMSFLPEKETAVGARLTANDDIEICAPFGTEGLLAGYLTPNPKREYAVFKDRLESKHWLNIWPNLVPQQIASPERG